MAFWGIFYTFFTNKACFAAKLRSTDPDPKPS
jgi:hypothetical protein